MGLRSFHIACEKRGGGEAAEWLASLAPVFTSDEPVILGTKGAQSIWASRDAVLNHAICERADLVGRPFLVDGRAPDHLGFCLMLNGAMEVEAGSLPVLAE